MYDLFRAPAHLQTVPIYGGALPGGASYQVVFVYGAAPSLWLILFVLYILISLIVPPIFQKEPIELEGAEFAGTGVTERVLCIDDNREALIWRLRLIDRAENEIILSTFDFRVDNSGKDMIAALNEAAERGVNIKILVDGISGDMYLRCNRLIGALAANTNVQIKLYSNRRRLVSCAGNRPYPL